MRCWPLVDLLFQSRQIGVERRFEQAINDRAAAVQHRDAGRFAAAGDLEFHQRVERIP